MLPENKVKEELSYAYVHAVAAHAGCSAGRPYTDTDSVDANITASGLEGILRSPQLDIQLKATSVAGNPAKLLRFPLPLKNYNDLRLRCAVPRILVVLVLPPEREQWLSHSHDGLVARRCSYWVDLLGKPPTENKSSVSVSLETSQVFDPATLTTLMGRIAQGGRVSG